MPNSVAIGLCLGRIQFPPIPIKPALLQECLHQCFYEATYIEAYIDAQLKHLSAQFMLMFFVVGGISLYVADNCSHLFIQKNVAVNNNGVPLFSDVHGGDCGGSRWQEMQ